MFLANLRKYSLFLLLASLVFGCSHPGIQSKKEGPDSAPLPECRRNHTREGGLVSHPAYRTWVRYDHLEFKKAFGLVVRTLKSHGHGILLTDPGSGTISAQMFLGTEPRPGYPATVKIAEDHSSIVVQISLRGTWGTLAPPDLCSFYDEFGRMVKRESAETQIKAPVLSPPIPPEAKKESSPLPSHPPSPLSLPPPQPSLPPPLVSIPPPAPSPPSSSPAVARPTSLPLLPRGKIIWVYVNLREGPGMNYKVIGRASKENTLDILDQNQDWLRVRLENGKEGWMSKKAARVSSKTAASQSPLVPSHDSSKTKSSRKRYEPM